MTDTEGSVLLHCHAGCDPRDVVAAVGLSMADLFAADYHYPDGRVVTRSYKPDGSKMFRQSGNKSGKALYGSDRLDGAQTVYVVEGEKDVDSLRAVGATAVSSAMGSGNANKFDWSPLHGKTVVIVADDDVPGMKYAEAVTTNLKGHADVRVVKAAVGKDISDHIAAGKTLDELASIRTPGGRRLAVVRGDEVKARRIDWVVPDWIPDSSLVLLAGREGLGKSTIACQIGAQITQGTLEGILLGTPRNILYLHSEDSREHTVAPRLKAAGADMSRVLFVDVQSEHTDTGTVVLPVDLVEFERVIAEHEVALVILDAATSAMASELSGRDDREVRKYLEPLTEIANRQGCVMLGIVHFGKRESADSGKLILGSIAWSQVPRSVLSVALDEESGHLVVTNTKKNLAPRQRSMEAEIRSVPVDVDGGVTDVGVLHWLGETELAASDLLAAPEGEADDVAEAVRWLQDYMLQEVAGASRDIKAAARKVGISERSLQRSAKRLGLTVESKGFPRLTWWSWPVPLGATDPHAREAGATGATGRDQHEHVGATGADSQSRQPPVHGATAGVTDQSTAAPPTSSAPPGAPTASTPGMTDRVQQILAKAQSETGRACPGCDADVPAGHVQCPQCYQARQQGVA